MRIGFLPLDESLCGHEPAPIPLAADEILSGGVIVDCSTFPRAGGSRFTRCIHCGAPMVGQRDQRVRITIWAWRELNGLDPYGDAMPVPDDAKEAAEATSPATDPPDA